MQGRYRNDLKNAIKQYLQIIYMADSQKLWKYWCLYLLIIEFGTKLIKFMLDSAYIYIYLLLTYWSEILLLFLEFKLK